MNRLCFILGFVIAAAFCLHFVKDDINTVAVKLQHRNADAQAYTKASE